MIFHDISFTVNQEWYGLEESHPPPHKKWIVQKDYGISEYDESAFWEYLGPFFQKISMLNLDGFLSSMPLIQKPRPTWWVCLLYHRNNDTKEMLPSWQLVPFDFN